MSDDDGKKAAENLIRKIEEWRAKRELNSRSVVQLADLMQQSGTKGLEDTIIRAIKGLNSEADFLMNTVGEMVDFLTNSLESK